MDHEFNHQLQPYSFLLQRLGEAACREVVAH